MATLIPPFDLAKQIGEEKLEIEAATLGELLDKCNERFGEPFSKMIQTAAIVVNGRSINYLKGKKTPLTKDDTIWIVKPSSGG